MSLIPNHHLKPIFSANIVFCIIGLEQSYQQNVARAKSPDIKVTKPLDVKRYQQFKQDVEDLMHYGHMRHYTAEIEGKTKESRGNISDYYNGKKPISNNFLKKFHKAYDRLLKKIREAIPGTEPTLAVNVPVQPLQANQEEQTPNVAIDPPLISEYLSSFQEAIMEKLISIEARLERLEQKIDPPAAHPKKD